MIFIEGVFYLIVMIFGLVQLIVISGWIAYALLPEQDNKKISSNKISFSGVDIIVPVNSEKTKAEYLVEDLQAAHRNGAQVVLLDSSNFRPLSIPGERSKTIRPINDSGWLLCQTEWGVHCWGPPPPGYKSGVLNLWLEYSDAEIALVIDADWRVECEDLAPLIDTLRKNPEAAFSQGKWEFQNTEETWISRADSLTLSLHHEVEQKLRAEQGIPFNMNGSLTAMRREVIIRLGGFDGTQLSEDVDLGYRLAKTELHGIYAESARASGRLMKDIVGFRDQKIRWAAGRFQALWRHGLSVLTNGSLFSRLLSIHYLVEYVPPVSTTLLLPILIYPILPKVLRLMALLLVLTPILLRFFWTCRRVPGMSALSTVIMAALGDAVLRFMLTGTCVILFFGTIVGWSPGWKWNVSGATLSFIFFLLFIFSPFLLLGVSDFIGVVGWILSASVLGTSVFMWGWPALKLKTWRW